MPIEITMPRLSDTMEEGTLIKWNVKVGDKVESGQVLADVETDKATMELQAFDDGTVAKIQVAEGDTAPVGELIMVLAEEGESAEDAAKAAGQGGGEKQAAEPTKETQAKPEPADQPAAEPASAGAGQGGGRIRVSPVARKIAEDKNLDLGQIKGSGPDGRIIKRDVLAAAEQPTPAQPEAAAQPAAAPAAPAVAPMKLEAQTIKLSGMRKTIAKRLVESKTTIPHFQVSMSMHMDPLMELRKTLNQQLEPQGVKLSVNDFVVRAVALACVQHPVANSSWADDSIQVHGTVNVGIAVALPADKGGGLVVPVIRDAQSQGLRYISDQTKRLAKKARTGGLTTDEMAEGTITISNLGMYGVEHFTAIVNPPQSVILAIGAAIEKPIVQDGQLTVGHEMTITLSGDHRVLDGAVAAEYLQSLKQLLENPAALLV